MSTFVRITFFSCFFYKKTSYQFVRHKISFLKFIYKKKKSNNLAIFVWYRMDTNYFLKEPSSVLVRFCKCTTFEVFFKIILKGSQFLEQRVAFHSWNDCHICYSFDLKSMQVQSDPSVVNFNSKLLVLSQDNSLFTCIDTDT